MVRIGDTSRASIRQDSKPTHDLADQSWNACLRHLQRFQSAELATHAFHLVVKKVVPETVLLEVCLEHLQAMPWVVMIEPDMHKSPELCAFLELFWSTRLTLAS